MRRLFLIFALLFALPAYAGPADPPTLPALPEPGQVVGISRFSVADIQKLPNPGNPPTGLIRLYADSTTGNLTCLTSTGGNCLTGGGGGTCPSGSANDIQVSNGTNCIGDTNFTWNPATQSFSVTSPLGGTINLSTGGGGGVNENIILSPSAINIGANDAGVPIIFSTFHGPQMQISSANGNIEFGGGGFDAPIKLDGSTSGSSIIGVPAVAGTPNRINLPTTTGSSGNCLKTDGASPQQTSWGTCSTTTGTVTSVATTGPIGGGTITSTGTITCATCLTATTPTNHGVLLGAGTQAVGATAAPATANEPLVSGASADPAFLPYAIPATIAAHQTLVATSTTVVAAKTIPDCTDTTGNHLNYTQSSDAYSCGTSDITQNTPAVVGKSITAYNSTTGAFTQSNGMCAPQFSSTDTLTAAATSPTETVFATQCSIPANTIIAGTVIRGVVGIDWTATATVPNFIFKVKLCSVSGCASGTVINIYTSPTAAPSAGTFSTSIPILIQGTAAAGATATIAQAINSGSVANAIAGRNSVAGLVANVPTNGTLFLQFSASFSSNAATNSMTITSLTFAP